MSVSIANWGGLEAPVFGAMDQIFKNNQANADGWMSNWKDAMNEWKTQREQEVQEFIENENKWRTVQNAIALLQQAAAFYFANKQYQAAKEAQDHQIEVWKTEKEWAKRYQDLWYNKYRPIEEKFLKEKAEVKPYVAKYDEAEARAVTDVRREFAMARENLRKCVDPRCIGVSCSLNKQIAIAEARAAIGAINKGYRAEEARKDIKDAQRDEAIFSLLQLGRGLQAASLNALNSAAAAAATAATYKPYAGYQAAVGNMAGYWQSYAADRAGAARQNASILGRQASNYSMRQGYTGNTATSINSFGYGAPQVTGSTGGFSQRYNHG